MTIQDIINHIMTTEENPAVLKSMLESLQTSDNPDWSKEVNANAAHVLSGSKVYINNVLTTGTCDYNAELPDVSSVTQWAAAENIDKDYQAIVKVGDTWTLITGTKE